MRNSFRPFTSSVRHFWALNKASWECHARKPKESEFASSEHKGRDFFICCHFLASPLERAICEYSEQRDPADNCLDHACQALTLSYVGAGSRISGFLSLSHLLEHWARRATFPTACQSKINQASNREASNTLLKIESCVPISSRGRDSKQRYALYSDRARCNNVIS